MTFHDKVEAPFGLRHPFLLTVWTVEPRKNRPAALRILARRSSLPAVVGNGDLQYDPDREDALADLMLRLIDDAGSRAGWRPRALERAAGFSWNKTLRRTYDIYRTVPALHSR